MKLFTAKFLINAGIEDKESRKFITFNIRREKSWNLWIDIFQEYISKTLTI